MIGNYFFYASFDVCSTIFFFKILFLITGYNIFRGNQRGSCCGMNCLVYHNQISRNGIESCPEEDSNP